MKLFEELVGIFLVLPGAEARRKSGLVFCTPSCLMKSLNKIFFSDWMDGCALYLIEKSLFFFLASSLEFSEGKTRLKF